MKKYQNLQNNLNNIQNLKLEISYDGTNYSGFQIQQNAITIQEVIENVLFILFKEKIRIKYSGRTDAGVHSKGQVINFHIEKSKIPLNKIKLALCNILFNKQITINTVKEVDNEFHSRYDSKVRMYRYYISLNKNDIFFNKYSVYMGKNIYDIEKLQNYLKPILGSHDFTNLASSKDISISKTREIFEINVIKKNEFIIIDIYGNAFLKNMVRGIIGNLFYAYNNLKDYNYFDTILKKNEKIKNYYTAPAKGLFLQKVYYDKIFGYRKYYN